MIALVDCNNFFASCERLFRPDLKNVPVLVLSNNDGCVVARSNEVKDLGIPMGVPYFKIRDVVDANGVQCFSSNFALYSNMSQRILGVLERHSPQIEVYSIDEAFMNLDVLPHQDFTHWGEELREEIARTIGMPVSVGIAPTKTLAKLASAYAKKHKQTCCIDPERNLQEYEQILGDTPIGAVWGVGWRTAPKLLKFGIRNALQLSNVSEEWIHSQMGINGTRLWRELNGFTAYPFEEEAEPQKTLMVSRSFGHTVKNTHDLETAVASFASQAAYRLRKNQQVTSQFGVYLRYRSKDGETKSRSAYAKFTTPSNNTTELVQIALNLMYELYDEDYGYKKAGVFANHLTSANVCQVDLFDTVSADTRTKQKSFMGAVDAINQRYGSETIHVGSIDPKRTKWHALKKRMSPAYTTDWTQLPRVHIPVDH
jgi:DNA polymerase V